MLIPGVSHSILNGLREMPPISSALVRPDAQCILFVLTQPDKGDYLSPIRDSYEGMKRGEEDERG